MNLQRLRCPICGYDRDSYGRYWPSEFSLASHVLSLAKGKDAGHLDWLEQRLPEADLAAWKESRDDSTAFSASDRTAIRRLVPVITEWISALETPEPAVLISRLEKTLHEHVRRSLEKQYGGDWWTQGVPQEVRKDCAARREEDNCCQESYAYTTFIELRKIIDKQWRLFTRDLERCRPELAGKPELLSALDKINRLRNKYMHPVRAPGPGALEYDGDLVELRRYDRLLHAFCAVLT